MMITVPGTETLGVHPWLAIRAGQMPIGGRSWTLALTTPAWVAFRSWLQVEAKGLPAKRFECEGRA